MASLRIAKYAVLPCLLIICFSLCVVRGQQASVGVSPGDSFTYEFSVLWISSDPNVAPPAELYSVNETNLIRVTVTDVGGAVVVMNITRYFKNGTSTTTQTLVNILSGDGGGFGLIIASNLNASAIAYPYALLDENKSMNAIPLKELIIKKYPFGEREVLHATINQTGSSTYARISHDIYFDRKTGVMLEWRVEQIPYISPTAKVVVTWKIKDFNVKEAVSSSTSPEQAQPQQIQWYLPIATIIVLLVVALAIYLRKRRK
ncbi:MAG: hypothetical protein QXQ41_02930 [Candidatus Bathyarchaeia archaeon]